MTAPLRLGPGVYSDVPQDAYHADPCVEPSLSSSLAKVLVAKTPRHAWLGHPRLNPKFEAEADSKFDLGSAVHDVLSSDGRRVQMVHGFKDWRSGEAQKRRKEVREAGLVPLLEDQYVQVATIVHRAREQMEAASVDLGQQESVLIAEHRGVWLRAMMDSLALPWINDFKVTKISLANDKALARHIVDTGYDLRAAFYIHVAELLHPDWAGRIGFRWLFLEEDEPHGLRIIEADATMREMGRRKMQFAIDLWSRCIAENRWPLFDGMPRTLPYPSFLENEWLEREMNDPTFVTGPVEMLGRQNAKRESLIDD